MKTKRGMSFVMALVFFLTCALLGTAMLSMAQSYGKRIVKKQKKEEEYLAVVSAMELVKEQLESCGGAWDLELLDTEQELQGQILKEIRNFCIAYENNLYGAQRKRILSISLEEDEKERWKQSEVTAVMTFQGLDLWDPLPEDMEEHQIPLCIEIMFSLADEEEEPLMSLNAAGVIIYEEDDYMEIEWEEIIAERNH